MSWKDGEGQHFTVGNSKLTSDTILSLEEDAENRIWVGTVAGVTIVADNRVVQTLTREQGIPGEWVRALFLDQQNRMWIGTSAGLAIWDGSFVRVFDEATGLPSEIVRDIVQAPDGHIWVATESGLVEFNDLELVNVYGQIAGLRDPFILSLLADQDGTIWVGTKSGGLYRFRDNQFFAFNSGNGLFDDRVFRILDDGNGRLWMSSNLGIYSVQKAEIERFAAGQAASYNCLHFDESDGMPDRECVGFGSSTGIRDSQGRLWFATLAGLAIISPRSSAIADQPLKIVLEHIIINDKQRLVVGGSRLTLPAGTEKIEFGFASLSFATPERIVFRHQLEGFDKEFSRERSDRHAIYTNLPPNSYTFAVQAAYPGYDWSDISAVSFSIKPHFTQTPLFFLLCALAIGFFVWAGVKWKVMRMKAGGSHLRRKMKSSNKSDTRHAVSSENKSTVKLIKTVTNQ